MNEASLFIDQVDEFANQVSEYRWNKLQSMWYREDLSKDMHIKLDRLKKRAVKLISSVFESNKITENDKAAFNKYKADFLRLKNRK